MNKIKAKRPSTTTNKQKEAKSPSKLSDRKDQTNFYFMSKPNATANEKTKDTDSTYPRDLTTSLGYRSFEI